jgi:hypothetical protein
MAARELDFFTSRPKNFVTIPELAPLFAVYDIFGGIASVERSRYHSKIPMPEEVLQGVCYCLSLEEYNYK